MSASGFGTTRPAALMETPAQKQLEQSLAESKVLEKHYEYEAVLRRAQAELELRTAQLRGLSELTRSLAANLGNKEVLARVTSSIRRITGSDCAVVALRDSGSGRLGVSAYDLSDDTVLDDAAQHSVVEALGRSVLAGKLGASRADCISATDMETNPSWAGAGFRSGCILPLFARDHILGVLAVSKREESVYARDEVD